VRLANWFTQSRGLVTACQMIIGDLATERGEIERREQDMDEALERENLVAFTKVVVVPDFERGVVGAAQASGLSRMRANTIMFGWPEKRERLLAMLRILRAASNAGRSTLIARLQEPVIPIRRPRIVVWWRGQQHNGDLMLLLAYLLQVDPAWQEARISVRSIAESEAERDELQSSLAQLIPKARIIARPEVIVRAEAASFADVIHERSAGADIVFLGLRDPAPGDEEAYADSLTELVEGLPTTVFVRNGGEFAGKLI
jgi:hypothetical protein